MCCHVFVRGSDFRFSRPGFSQGAAHPEAQPLREHFPDAVGGCLGARASDGEWVGKRVGAAAGGGLLALGQNSSAEAQREGISRRFLLGFDVRLDVHVQFHFGAAQNSRPGVTQVSSTSTHLPGLHFGCVFLTDRSEACARFADLKTLSAASVENSPTRAPCSANVWGGSLFLAGFTERPQGRRLISSSFFLFFGGGRA